VAGQSLLLIYHASTNFADNCQARRQKLAILVSLIDPQWSNGRMVEWSNGRMVEWSNGRMVEWSGGTMTRIASNALLSGAITFSFAALFSSPSGAQSLALIAQAVDNGQRITLVGNTRPEAAQANDVGAVSDNFEMPHMLLQLKRSNAQQQQLEELAANVSDPSSPSYRQFLTGAQFAAAYGPNPQDVQFITGWLQSEGFQVNAVYPTANVIDFSGTAGQVRAAFGTPIHQLNVNGASYVANMNGPQIPSALAGAVAGPVALNNFQPQPALTQASTNITKSPTVHDIVPGDHYTIYNWTPLFGLGITGKGQTIGIMSESDTPGSTATTLSTSDWHTFRNSFNLNSPPFAGTATLTALHPNGCSHSVNAAEDEADVDVEYSSAAAPDANILLVSCDAGFPGGIIAALTGTLALPKPPGVISISYGECEAHAQGGSCGTQ
jgi:subtilase family serine protease